MTPELTYLTYAVILLIAHALIQATFSDLSKGIGWALGPQDEHRDQAPIAARIQRALKNYLETLRASLMYPPMPLACRWCAQSRGLPRWSGSRS